MLPSLELGSDEWLAALQSGGEPRERAVGELHRMLLRVTRNELRRRSEQLRISGPELDDLAHQAAADALMSLLRKLGEFRGESRFTTWAYRFAIIEVSSKVGRSLWRNPTVALAAEDWERLPDRFGFEPAQQSEWRDLMAALRHAVETELSDRQRAVFVAIVLNGTPLDALVFEMDSNRNAIYKILFDARRKLRVALVAGGHLSDGLSGRS